MTVGVVTVGVTVGVVTVGVVTVGGRVGRAFSIGVGDRRRRRRCGDGGLDRFFGLGLDRDLLSTTPRM